MNKPETGQIKYCIFDPTGNITALVESPVIIDRQPGVADGIMKKHPEVEQVGFISLTEDAYTDTDSGGLLFI